jgi:aflatoxin B1 aldehyde reductase
MQQSLNALRLPCVDILYLHAPDPVTPLLETCNAMHQAHETGKFDRFGISNFSVDQTRMMLHLCDEYNLRKPSVYQGQYNIMCRDAEIALFDLLREHSISFYAYSPAAAGFLSDRFSPDNASDPKSRWCSSSPLGSRYIRDYFQDHLLLAANEIKCSAQKYGITGHAAALRWIAWHSELDPEKGDAIIVGASTTEQLEENLQILEHGLLPPELVDELRDTTDHLRDRFPRPSFALVNTQVSLPEGLSAGCDLEPSRGMIVSSGSGPKI